MLTACGAESHPNEPRPPVAPEVTVNIAEDRLSVSPAKVAFEDGSTTAISQNRDVQEVDADPDLPLIVNCTVANSSDEDTKLVLSGDDFVESPEITARGTLTFRTELATGTYRMRAPGVPRALPVPFSVGPERKSAQSDLLLP
jgi:hypothetical protein